jgi:hypothetical protein
MSDEERLEWAEALGFGAALDSRLYDRGALAAMAEREGLDAQVAKLTELQMPPGLTTMDKAADLRKEVADFWTVTSAGLLEDGNTNTLGAKKPLTLARLVEQLQSFVVLVPEQRDSLHRLAQRLIVTHKMNDAVRIEQEFSAVKKKIREQSAHAAAAAKSTTSTAASALVQAAFADDISDGGDGMRHSAATREVQYDPSVELSMFFLSSMLACTKAGQNIKPQKLQPLLEHLEQILAASSFFGEWSPPPSMPPHLDVNLVGATARSPTGTSRGTERVSPIHKDVRSAWISTPPRLVDDPECAVLWSVAFDVPAPVAVCEVSVTFLCAGHATLDQYSEIQSSDVVFPLRAELRLGVSDVTFLCAGHATLAACSWSAPEGQESQAVMQAKNYSKMLTVTFTIEGGRTASMLELALFPGTRMQRIAHAAAKGTCPRGRIAVCDVSVKCKSDSTRLPVPRDRRKTIGDLNAWIQSVVASDDLLPSTAALRCQFLTVESSGCLSSVLCLVQCLIADDSLDGLLASGMLADAEGVLGPLCHGLVASGKYVQSGTATAELKSALEEYKYHSAKKEGGSDVSPFVAKCIQMALGHNPGTGNALVQCLRKAQTGHAVAITLMQTVARMGCAHMMSRDNVLERKYCIECEPEMIERSNAILGVCLRRCRRFVRQKKRVTAHAYSDLARETLYVLGACMRRFDQSGVKREDTRLFGKRADDAMLALRATLETFLDEGSVHESTRHAAAGVMDTGFELVYSSSTQRVSMVADLFKRYAENPFPEDSGSHMLLLHVFYRLRRVGGSVSMLPSPQAAFDHNQLNDAVVPLQSWLRMLKPNKARRGRKLSGSLLSGGVQIDAASMAAGLLSSIFRHLCVTIGGRIERTARIGDGGVLEVPVLNLLDRGAGGRSGSSSSDGSFSRDASYRSVSEESQGGGAGESKRQILTPAADAYRRSTTSTNPLAGLVEGVIRRAEQRTTVSQGSGQTAAAQTSAVPAPAPAEPELTDDLRGLITAGLVTRAQALEMMGYSAPAVAPALVSGPPRAASAGSDISFVQVNRRFPRHDKPVVRGDGNDNVQFIMTNEFHTFVAPELAVNSGKWFFEIRVDSDLSAHSAPQFGWADPARFDPHTRVGGTGDDAHSYAIDATRTCYFHKTQSTWLGGSGYSRYQFKKGAIVTCSVDLKSASQGGYGSIFFHVNGNRCPTPPVAFRKIKAGTYLVPAISMSKGSVTVRCGGKPYMLSQAASSWRQGCKFLMLSRGALSLSVGSLSEDNLGRTCDEWKVVSRAGVAYRNSPSMGDRWTIMRGPHFGDHVKALERCGLMNNWIKTHVPGRVDLGYKYLPIKKNREIILEIVPSSSSSRPNSDLVQETQGQAQPLESTCTMTQINPHIRGAPAISSVRDAKGNIVCSLKLDHGLGFKTYALDSVGLKTGKFYYEVEICKNGGKPIESRGWYPQLGWIDAELFRMQDSNSGVGDDAGCSWGVDGERKKYWANRKNTAFQNTFKCKTGTVVGCYIS